MAWLMIQMQFALHGAHQALGMTFGILDFEVFHLLGTIDTRALERELQQLSLLATLGHSEDNLIEQNCSRGQERYDNLTREIVSDIFDNILNSHREHILTRRVHTRGQAHRMQSHNGAMAQTDEITICHVIILEQREDVAIDNPGTHHHRAALIVLQRIQTLLETLCRLEAQVSCRREHILLQITTHRTQIALQHILYHIGQQAILLLALLANAGALAVAQMVLQADAIFAFCYGLRREI